MGPESLLLDQLAETLTGRWLVAEEADSAVVDAIAERGAEPVRWSRYAWVNSDAATRPPEGPFHTATLSLPKGKEVLAYAVEAIACRLEEGASLYLYGHNDTGIKSAAKKLEPWFTNAETLDTKRHSRLWHLTRTDAPARDDLEAFASTETLPLPAGEVSFVGFPGLFAKCALDPATALLADALQQRAKPVSDACDFATGLGVLGRVMQDRWPEANLTLTDADALSGEAARRNLPSASVHLMNGWQLPSGPKYDLIVSNPPIHVGQQLELGIITQLVQGAARTLRKHGQLVVVVQRQRPIERDLKAHFKKVSVIAEDRLFRVWLAE